LTSQKGLKKRRFPVSIIRNLEDRRSIYWFIFMGFLRI